MSQPLARYVGFEDEDSGAWFWRVFVGDTEVGVHFSEPEEAAEVVAAVNAVVEAREAKLCGTIDAAAKIVDAAISRVRRREASVPAVLIDDLLSLSDVLGFGNGTTVSGDVACALAWDLGAAEGRLKGRVAVLFDAVMEHPNMDGFTFAKMVETFGAAPLRPSAAMLTDDQLLTECLRRGMQVIHPSSNGSQASVQYANWSGAQPELVEQHERNRALLGIWRGPSQSPRYISPTEFRRRSGNLLAGHSLERAFIDEVTDYSMQVITPRDPDAPTEPPPRHEPNPSRVPEIAQPKRRLDGRRRR